LKSSPPSGVPLILKKGKKRGKDPFFALVALGGNREMPRHLPRPPHVVTSLQEKKKTSPAPLEKKKKKI